MAYRPTDGDCMEALLALDSLVDEAAEYVRQADVSKNLVLWSGNRHLTPRRAVAVLRHLEREGYAERDPYRKAPHWRPTVDGLNAIRKLIYPLTGADAPTRGRR